MISMSTEQCDGPFKSFTQISQRSCLPVRTGVGNRQPPTGIRLCNDAHMDHTTVAIMRSGKGNGHTPSQD